MKWTQNITDWVRNMTLEQPKKAINPYAAGDSVGGSDAFVGRTDILQAVQKNLNDSQQKAITLFGQRRIGKTSILRQLEVDLLKQGNYKLVFFDLLGKAFQPLEVTLQDLANRISDALTEANPKLTNIADFHQHWLPRVLKAKESSCLVLLLDEFDALEDAASKKASENFFYYLRDHLLTLHPRLKFVFAIGRNREDLTGVAMSLFKGIHAEQVSLLPYQDTVQLIRFSENNQTLTWSKEAIETIWQLTSGHPYLTQMLCWQTWETLLMREQLATPIPQVTAEDVKQRVARTLTASHNALQWLWKGLPPSEKIVTSVIATANRPIQEQELATLLQQKGIRITEQLPTILLSLEQWDLIEKRAEDNYGIRVELIRQWVAENESLAQIQTEINRVHPQADAVYKSALAFYQGDDYDSAINDVKRALKLNSNHSQANQLLAEILIKRNDLEEALQHLENFYQYQPSFARGQLLHVLSTLAKQSKDTEQQISYYKQILEIDPEYEEAQYRLRVFYKLINIDEFISKVKKTLQNHSIEAVILDMTQGKIIFDNTRFIAQANKIINPVKLLKRYQSKIELVFNDEQMRHVILQYSNKLIVNVHFLDYESVSLAICLFGKDYGLGRFILQCEEIMFSIY
jgi:tetratricopeptide (TPR) repeat protein